MSFLEILIDIITFDLVEGEKKGCLRWLLFSVTLIGIYIGYKILIKE